MNKLGNVCTRLLLGLVVLGLAPALGARQTAGSGESSGTTEIFLSGTEWKLGSFPMGKGEEGKAYEVGFDERDFRPVPVPAEIQLTLGLEGNGALSPEQGIIADQQKRVVVSQAFHASQGIRRDKRISLVFDGSDYFTTVWLNGEKLGDHEGAYTSFSFDITSRVKPGADNVLAVKVTCPWLLKDRGLAEYMKGSFCLVWPGITTTFAQSSACAQFLLEPASCQRKRRPHAGLIRDVKLVISPPLSMEDVFVYTEVNQRRWICNPGDFRYRSQ